MWCSNKQTPNLLAFLPSFTHLPANKRTQCHVGSELTHEQGFSRSETPPFLQDFSPTAPFSERLLLETRITRLTIPLYSG